MKQDPLAFREAAHEALDNPRLKAALGRMKMGFQFVRAHSFAALPDGEALREAGRAIKDHALSRLDDYLVQFETKVREAGGQVHWARDAAEARAIVTHILKESGAKTVTKGKSMIAEEVGLNPHLEREGIVPIETDLGEYIIQLRDEPPSHIIAPAFHLSRQDVEESFREAHTMLDPARTLADRRALVSEAREVLREKFLRADAGITGANFLVAETGSVVLVTNEGNGDLTRLLPRTHIVLTSIEKIVPTLAEVSLLLRLLTRSASGQEITAYVSFLTGPKRADDSGGPQAFHVVLLDNGRSRILGGQARDTLRCVRCGACMNHCPVYGAVGGHAYGTVYPGPIGAALNPALIGVAAARHHPNASTFCGRCETVCPVKIPLVAIMRGWRNEDFAQGHAPLATRLAMKLWAAFARRPELYALATRIAARVLGMLGGRRGMIGALPVLRGWFRFRDLPAPAAATFQAQWRKRTR